MIKNSRILFTLLVLLFSSLSLSLSPSSFSQSIIVPNSNKETVIDSNKITVFWNTMLPGDTKVDYGLTDSYEIGSVRDAASTQAHSITIPNLKPATIYHLKLRSKNPSGISISSDSINNWIVSTASQYSTGKINVYFNKSINPKISTGETANGDIYIPGVILNHIDSAKYSIDVCVYSFSGTVTQSSPYGVGSDLADALIRAKNRNVKVRFIIEYDNSSTSPVNKIKGSAIPLITDEYGQYDPSSLEHNKFYIFDARDSFTDKEAWVVTGSWNATNPGTFDDYQNIIEIQDKALAKAYTAEFNEMWGSETDQPNSSYAKFGKYKTDNTPHRFNLKGVPVELYFAPTDGVSYQIQTKIGNAMSSIMFSEMTFTSEPIAQAISILQKNKSNNIKVRGLINKDNLTDQGIQYGFLNTIPNSIVLPFDAQGGIYHHKYIILDGDRPDLTPWVMTGSYNITATAESSNNENLLFIQSSRIANLYLQEFTKRYSEAGGSDEIKILKVAKQSPNSFELSQNFPNPFNSGTVISYSLASSSFISLKVYNLLGQEVETLFKGIEAAGNYNHFWSPKNCPSGIYYYRLMVSGMDEINNKIMTTKRMIYLK